MSDNVIRDIGEFDPPPPAPIAVQIVERGPSRLELRAGERAIGTAVVFNLGPEWVVDFHIPGIPPVPAFLVTNRSEAIDALTQVGHIYFIAKSGELK
ncbi:hypothetical protein [Mycobacteroides chelonae]|uniref:hypothetical protein n=1 Tax=Mycobacteroides chelonae TaxID=1774 RepID=UPI0009943AC9|nr:hypothetical protein [Mycobacteroides chelonae]